MTFKRIFYNILPKFMRKPVKNFYYDKLLFPLYKLKYKLHYNTFDFFSSIAIETTTYCNLRCKNCPNSIYDRGILKNKKLMKLSLFKKIINQLSDLNYNGKVLLHFYGEPLTDKRLPYLVSYTKNKLPKASIHINTNGLLLNDKIFRQLLEAGVSTFLITQYSNSMPENIKELFSKLKKEERKKIKYRILGKDILISNRGGELKINKNRVVDFERPICTYPDNSVIIDYKGNLVLCCNDYHSSVVFGNLNKENLIDIWNKENYRILRQELRKGIFKLPICKKCVGIE